MKPIRYRFFEDGMYHYFGIPYMSGEMFNVLQCPKSDKRVFEQYTGTKDINDVELYFNDKIRMVGSGNEYVIIFRNGAFGYLSKLSGEFMPLHHLISSGLEFEIIGDVHEEEER